MTPHVAHIAAHDRHSDYQTLEFDMAAAERRGLAQELAALEIDHTIGTPFSLQSEKLRAAADERRAAIAQVEDEYQRMRERFLNAVILPHNGHRARYFWHIPMVSEDSTNGN